MIKIFLPVNFSSDPEIQNIYTKISQKLIDSLNNKKISFYYKGDKHYFDTAKSIRNFLLAEDFYNYKLKSSVDYYNEFIKVRSNISRKNKLKRTKISSAIFKLSIKLVKEELEEEMLEKEKLLEKTFSYSKLKSDYRHIILTKMDVQICPYCNINYTLTYKTSKGRRTTADLDHFYIKSKYPEYSLCLYNFVPSCPVCNRKLKGTNSMIRETHIFPHEDSFNGKAKFEIVNLIEVLMNKKQQLEIKLVNYKNNEKVNNSVDTFKINELYNSNKIYASELLDKVIVYNESFTEELQNSKDIFNEKPDVKQLVFGANLTEIEYARRSLGKLRIDLLNQLGVYKSKI